MLFITTSCIVVKEVCGLLTRSENDKPGQVLPLHSCHRLHPRATCNNNLYYSEGKGKERAKRDRGHAPPCYLSHISACASVLAQSAFVVGPPLRFWQTILEFMGVISLRVLRMSSLIQFQQMCLCLEHVSCHRMLHDEGSCTQAQTASSRRCTCLLQVECWHSQCMQPGIDRKQSTGMRTLHS